MEFSWYVACQDLEFGSFAFVPEEWIEREREKKTVCEKKHKETKNRTTAQFDCAFGEYRTVLLSFPAFKTRGS